MREKQTEKQTEKRRYQVVVGVSVAALEEELNRVETELELRQIMYAPGTGFVAVMERGHTEAKHDEVRRSRTKTS